MYSILTYCTTCILLQKTHPLSATAVNTKIILQYNYLKATGQTIKICFPECFKKQH